MIKSTELSKIIAKAIGNTLPEVENNRGAIYSIDFTVSGSANVRLGEDYETIHDAAIDWQAAFLFAIAKLNKASAETVLKEFLNVENSETPALTENKAYLKDIVNSIKGTSTRTMRGKFTISAETLNTCIVTSACLKSK